MLSSLLTLRLRKFTTASWSDHRMRNRRSWRVEYGMRRGLWTAGQGGSVYGIPKDVDESVTDDAHIVTSSPHGTGTWSPAGTRDS